MSDEAFWALLRRHDEAKRVEWPADFDHAGSEARVRAFGVRLQSVLQVPLRTMAGAHVQDASFHAEIVLPHALLLPTRMPGAEYSLRFSNFGDMAAIGGDEDVDPAILATIRRELEAAGYTLIPTALLAQPYDGRVADKRDIPNWWFRYFDYL